MTKIIIAVFSLFLLSACETNPPKIIVEKEYVIRKAPDNLKKIPDYPLSIDITTANQIDLANWILLSEERQWQLENKINELILFYEAPIKK